jgi:hypothetical protein
VTPIVEVRYRVPMIVKSRVFMISRGILQNKILSPDAIKKVLTGIMNKEEPDISQSVAVLSRLMVKFELPSRGYLLT